MRYTLCQFVWSAGVLRSQPAAARTLPPFHAAAASLPLDAALFDAVDSFLSHNT